jgi:hypothetical protein
MTDLDDELVERVRQAISGVATADDAMARIAEAMPEDLAISRVGVRVHDLERNLIVIVAVWSRMPTALTAGMTHPTTGALSESFTTVARSRTSSIRFVGRDPYLPPAIQQILADEGNASGVIVPLPKGSAVPGVLVICSARADAFRPADIPFFDRLGEELAEPLLTLAGLRDEP